MNKDQLKVDIKVHVDALERFQREVGRVLETVKRTLTAPDASGENVSSMEDCLRLMEHELCSPKLRSHLTKMHQLLWKNAQYNLEQAVKDRAQKLEELKPTLYRSKRAKKADLPEAPETTATPQTLHLRAV